MKGQTSIVGFVMITAIALIIISVTIFWAQPLISKTQNQQEVQSLEIKFLELHNSVKHVAATQSSSTVQIDLSKGIISLNGEDNSVIYRGQYDLANPTPRKAIFGNISQSDIESFNITQVGTLGQDEPAVLIVQGGVEFFLHYRPLNDSSGNCHRIKLIPGKKPGTGAGRSTISLTWKGENQTSFAGCASLTDQLVEFNVL